MQDRIHLPLGSGQDEILPIEWVDLIVQRAVKMKASDIHFDLAPDKFVTRFRMDGLLRNIDEGIADHSEMVIARLKIMSLMNSAEHRLPQEGHAMVEFIDEGLKSMVDIRISIFPTIYGEVAAIRILNRREFLFETFQDMGMSQKDADLFEETIRRPHGMILVTGPTGSGKSAALYTALRKISTPERNIITLEDPVEYQLENTRQSQINPDAGFTFAKGMRSILRQDPDVVMIGEIRDEETAEIAVRAALTGHLLFSTMHTNDAVGAVIRFLEFGIPRSFVATAMVLVVAKRLVRQLCPHCASPQIPLSRDLEQVRSAGYDAVTFYKGTGCDKCENTGYLGRTGAHEFFYITDDIKMAILDGVTSARLFHMAKETGMRSLRQDAIRLAIEGRTSLDEALRATI